MKFRILHEITDKGDAAPEKVVDLILRSRGIEDTGRYLNPPSPTSLRISDFDPAFGKSLRKVLKKLEEIRSSGRTIIVYTDYDADGITGGTIAWETLHLLGFSARPYVPHRVHEGYGFSMKGIDAVKKEYDPALIISVDHGISAREQIRYATDLGIPVVVTDHHLKPEQIPDTALAIFHIPALSGSGVAYVFAKAIFDHFQRETSVPKTTISTLQTHFETDYAALAAVGTIADLVPLSGPSRDIVYHGLAAFSRIKRVGMKELLASAGIAGKPVTPYEVGFMIAPRINAIGRLEHAIDALRLLCTTSSTRAAALTSRIDTKNAERQGLVKTAVDEAIAVITKKFGANIPALIVLTSDHWHEGIIGLIASRIMDTYYRPAIVMTRADGYHKGSARSIPSLHITDFLRSQNDLLISVGGHAQAAGFSIGNDKLNTFVKNLERKADLEIHRSDLERTLLIDIKIPYEYVTLGLARQLDALAPFGVANARPVFLSTVPIRDVFPLGKDGAHLRLIAENGMEFVYFGYQKNGEKKEFTGLQEIAYSCEINRWNGSQRLQAKVVFM